MVPEPESVNVSVFAVVEVPKVKFPEEETVGIESPQLPVPVSFVPLASQHSFPAAIVAAEAALLVVVVMHFAVPVSPKSDVVEQMLAFVSPVIEET